MASAQSATVENNAKAGGGARTFGRAGGNRASRPDGPPAVALDRVLPHSPEAEVAVLGAMLLDPDVASSFVRDRISEQAFYSAAHQVIFREIAALQDALQAIDLVTLTTRLQNKNLLEEVGGAAYLTELITKVPTAANVEHYVDIVSEKFLLRQLISASVDIIGRAFDEQDDVRGWVEIGRAHV